LAKRSVAAINAGDSQQRSYQSTIFQVAKNRASRTRPGGRKHRAGIASDAPDYSSVSMQARVVSSDRARYISFVAASLSILHLLAVLGAGYLWVTTDWRVMECFDGTEVACSEPARDVGLSAVQAASWLLASVAFTAAIGAFVLALRLRRVAQVAPVLLLCATSAVAAEALWWLL
jgi:hypothetical protein